MFRVLKDPLEPEVPFVYGVALSNFNFQDEPDAASLTCSGKGMTVDEAKRSALGEGIERYCGGQYDEKKLIVSQYGDLTNAVDPADLVLYSHEQYASRLLPYAEFQDKAQIRWVEGHSLTNQRSRLIPAIAVYLNYHPMGKQEYLFPPTSNGLAAGSSLSHAILNGLLEVVERDAFLITWLANLPMPQVDVALLQNAQSRDLIYKFDRRGVKIHINSLTLDTGIPTFLATAVDASGSAPAITVGLGSHPDPETGILRSIEEIGQVRPHLKRESRKADFQKRLSRLKDFRSVQTIQDHEMLYADPGMIGSFDFLLKNGLLVDPSKIAGGPTSGVDQQLAWCKNQLDKLGVDIIWVDVTTQDVAELGLSVARVIITKFQPMHFGYYEARLGGDRLFELPERLGFTEQKLTVEELNTLPHPLG